MSSPDETYEPEPSHTWKRKDYSPIPKETPARKRAEMETDRDLTKSIEQLLGDFHDMAEGAATEGGDPTSHMLHAQKRMVGMMAKVALSNEAVQRSNDILQHRLYWVAIAVAALTIISTVFGAIQTAHAIATWPK